ncbi:zinc-binding alcohol dehydrogenase family protein [Sphingobium sp. Sx8-8]|uniref:zinc-binding alcohol dehydrogenase family protein n=1 Tax=Sphingobium sp. Sx8-8 TaxID=2933617 RepID=UPI001F5732A2|nr:zinc-binding alcohol dehydrogenase family protein [Sphingobium sp. Sx8-8]
MKTVVCSEPFTLNIEQRPRPRRGKGEVLIQVNRVGICGTDYHIFAGNQPFLSYPRVMGHELAGSIVEADAASVFKPGQIVTINPYLACGQCVACRKGKPNCCVGIRVLGVHADGGMAELIAVPEEALVEVDGLTLDQAAMVEFLSVGAHAVRRGKVQPADRVLVVGAGPIGIAAAIFAKAEGGEVTLIDTSIERLQYARDHLGFDRVERVEGDIAERLGGQTGGEFFDVVFDATGSPHAIEAGFAYVAHGGTYVLISVVKGEIKFSDAEFHKREMQLVGSRNATAADFRRVISAIRDGMVPAAAMHTHSFLLEEAATQIPELIANQSKVIKAIGRFSDGEFAP